MQTFRSEYGRPGIRVEDTVPTWAIQHKLGNVHVATPVSEVEAMVAREVERRAACDDGWTDKVIRDTLRFARWQHKENRAEYRYVMGGWEEGPQAVLMAGEIDE